MTKSTKYVILFYKNEYKIKEDIYFLNKVLLKSFIKYTNIKNHLLIVS